MIESSVYMNKDQHALLSATRVHLRGEEQAYLCVFPSDTTYVSFHEEQSQAIASPSFGALDLYVFSQNKNIAIKLSEQSCVDLVALWRLLQ
jgi:hypothetical protein